MPVYSSSVTAGLKTKTHSLLPYQPLLSTGCVLEENRGISGVVLHGRSQMFNLSALGRHPPPILSGAFRASSRCYCIFVVSSLIQML